MAILAQGRLGSRLISPAIRAQLRRRLDESSGIVLGLIGLGLLVALASYNPHDPSLDTATAQSPANLAGPVGAMVADLLLQGFGLAGALPGIAILAWAWRILTHRPLRPGLRVGGLVLALPALATVLAMIPGLAAHPWPTLAGLGGAFGSRLAFHVQAVGIVLAGPFGALIGDALAVTVAVGLLFVALGLSTGEWRAGWRHGQVAARGALELGQRGASFAQRTPDAMAWLFRPLVRSGPRPDEPLRPLPAPRGKARTGSVVPEGVEPLGEEDEEEEVAAPQPPSNAIATRPRATIRAPEATPAPRIGKNKQIPAAQQSLKLDEAGWRFPTLALLKPAPHRSSEDGQSRDALERKARLLESVLGEFGVQGTIRDIHPGPVVTLYELEPAPGIRSARVIGLADDIARNLSVTAVRIATVPGRNVIGIEVPNPKRETVYFSELLGAESWASHPGKLALALGKDINGKPVVADLARMPHLLIAGTTGSGKSVGVNAMILSLLYRCSPEQCRLILIDPKMLELSVYDGIPHLMAPVVTEPRKAVLALKWTVREMERRYRGMSQLGVRNIGSYNERVAEARAKGEVVTRRVQTGFDEETGRPTFEEQPLALEPLSFIVVVIDEMADLMMVAGKEIETTVQRLAQMARAAGIHVIMATQRPSVDVITGVIKANFPTRISFQVISKFDSRTILGEQGSEQLLGQGDMLYMAGGGRITRVHGPFVTDREVEDVVAFLRAQGEPAYLDDVTEGEDDDAGGGGAMTMSGIAGASEGEKGLFDQAVALVAREGKASTSFVQRHLSIGYNRAAKLIEQMEKEGIVSPANHVGKREVLVRRSDED